MVVPVCPFCYRFFCHHCLELETFTFFKAWEGAGYNGPLRLEPSPTLQCFHLERHGYCCGLLVLVFCLVFVVNDDGVLDPGDVLIVIRKIEGQL